MKHLQSFENLSEAKKVDDTLLKGVDPLGQPGYENLNDAFKKSQWKPAFTALGFRLPSMLLGQLVFEPDNNAKKKGPFYQLLDFVDPEPDDSEIGEWPTVHVPQFCVDPKNTPYFKVEYKFYPDENPPLVLIEGRTQTLKEMEDFVMDKYIRALKKASIKGFPPGKHPILHMMLDAFTGKLPLHIPTYFAEAVNQDPKSILRVPAEYQAEVSRLTGISSEELHSIQAAEDFGII